MNFKIFQAYYKPEHVEFLDPEFEPLDNTANLQGQYREYPLFLEIYQRAKEQNLDVWGYTSWKWRDKLYNLTAQNLLDHIANNPDYDVYFWNPFSDHAVAAINVWEQGQHWHPNLHRIMDHLLPILGLDSNWFYQPMLPDVMYFGLYCAGNNKFWQGFLEFATKYKDAIDNFPSDIKQLHQQGAGYPPFPELWYFPFIHERLLSMYLTVHYKDLKIFHYHHDKDRFGYMWDRLHFLKTMAIKYKEPEILAEWQALRTHLKLNYNFSTNWLQKFDKTLLSVYHK